MDLDTFSSKRKKRKKERETFMFKTVCWFDIAGILKEKRKEKGIVS